MKKLLLIMSLCISLSCDNKSTIMNESDLEHIVELIQYKVNKELFSLVNKDNVNMSYNGVPLFFFCINHENPEAFDYFLELGAELTVF